MTYNSYVEKNPNKSKSSFCFDICNISYALPFRKNIWTLYLWQIKIKLHKSRIKQCGILAFYFLFVMRGMKIRIKECVNTFVCIFVWWGTITWRGLHLIFRRHLKFSPSFIWFMFNLMKKKVNFWSVHIILELISEYVPSNIIFKFICFSWIGTEKWLV